MGQTHIGQNGYLWNQMTSTGRVGELGMTAEQMQPQKPSDYFQQNCWIGASFPAPSDAQAIRELE